MLLSVLLAAVAQENVRGQDQPLGDAARGQTFFQINCAVCHSPVLGPDNTVIMKQGPSLIGVVGRPSGSLPYFSYTKAIRESGFTWDPANLYQFLANPMVVVPGTTMPIPVTDPRNRADVIAYLGTLKIPEGVALKYEALPETAGGTDPNDWQRQARNIISRSPTCRSPSRRGPPGIPRKSCRPRPTRRWPCRQGSR